MDAERPHWDLNDDDTLWSPMSLSPSFS